MIFSRSRGSKGRHHRVDDTPRTQRTDTRATHDEFGSDDEELPTMATSGPYDVADAPDGVERLDLGSMWIPAVPGVEVRLQANPEGQIEQVVLVSGESALQLGVFAAPRTEGIWDEVRAEISQQLASDGFAAEEADGEYGRELRAQVRTPDGAVDLRFVGIDGPRWMVRGVYQGAAAADPDQAGPLATCLTGLVVDRGRDAMPVREPLPLRLPTEVTQQTSGADGAAAVAEEATSAAEQGDAEPNSGRED
ncbi:DUF3710 domain-containing protein [Planosporangium thailandense]|uniref:DUF3710 domain-containing protein n=1 Tax=Planosporangium thailandense TaxID=765197 RepID=A0ABX0XR60_9ACTN|nr:DUF3710 domain-containing protein [Planosporangium thailandense]